MTLHYSISGYGIDLSKYHNKHYHEIVDYLIRNFDDLADSVENNICNWDYNETPFNGAYIYIPDQPSVQNKNEQKLHQILTPDKANDNIHTFVNDMIEQILTHDDVYYLENSFEQKDWTNLSCNLKEWIDNNAKHFAKILS